MSKTPDLRALKDKATRALEKRSWAKAAELYLEIAQHEDDPAWRQRAGEALRKAGRTVEAIEQLAEAAEGFARGGFLLKAIAVCKLVLQIDPRHTETQRLLAELYAQRDTSTKSASGVSLVELPVLTPPAAPAPAPAPAPDAAALGPPPITSPLEVLPLSRILPSRPSGQIPAVSLDGLEGQAFEISIELVELEPEPKPEPVLVSIADEMDLAQEISRPPAPALPRIPLFSSLSPDELVRVIEGMQLREAVRGEMIVKQGDLTGSLYVIARGEVDVLVERAGEPPVRLATLTDGAFFGELALLTDSPRSATVIARGDTQLLEISRELCARIIADSPDVLKVLLRFFRERTVERLLSSSPVFNRFEPEDAHRLVDRFKLLEIEPRTRVVHQGERAPGLFLLLCGQARVQSGKRMLADLRPGDVFGEMSLLEHGKAMADIDARTKCWVLVLERADFQEIVLTHPQLLEYLSNLVEERRVENQLGADERVELF